MVLRPPETTVHGPSSNNRPVEELQPGPPFNQRVKGAVEGEDRDSKNLRICTRKIRVGKLDVKPTSYQKKRCLSSSISRYPEYCWTEESQSSGSVTRS